MWLETAEEVSFTPKDVIDALKRTGLSFRDGAIHTILDRLEKAGEVRKIERGKYGGADGYVSPPFPPRGADGRRG